MSKQAIDIQGFVCVIKHPCTELSITHLLPSLKERLCRGQRDPYKVCALHRHRSPSVGQRLPSEPIWWTHPWAYPVGFCQFCNPLNSYIKKEVSDIWTSIYTIRMWTLPISDPKLTKFLQALWNLWGKAGSDMTKQRLVVTYKHILTLVLLTYFWGLLASRRNWHPNKWRESELSVMNAYFTCKTGVGQIRVPDLPPIQQIRHRED